MLSVKPTVAVARAPSLPTKKISTSAKTLSIHISKIMGIANKKTALRKLPVVKSLSSLLSDSLIKETIERTLNEVFIVVIVK